MLSSYKQAYTNKFKFSIWKECNNPKAIAFSSSFNVIPSQETVRVMSKKGFCKIELKQPTQAACRSDLARQISEIILGLFL
jgi:hypothetical protein